MDQEILKLEGPIAVFGAGGFLGANLLRRILKIRSDCYGVNHQRYVTWRLAGVPGEQLVYADLTNANSVAALFDRFSFKTIFNFAAYGNYPKQRDVPTIYATNVMGAVGLLEVAREKGFSAYVQAGSSSEYGLNCEAPKEEGELAPNSHYAVSKVSTAYLMKYYGEVCGLPVINLRYYSIYGPYEEPDRLIPKLIENAAIKKLPVLVDPSISRDFIYVNDAVHATILAASVGVKKAPGESLNIGTGNKTTIGEIVKLVKETFDVLEEPSWSTMPNRTWDLKNWYANAERAEKILGWKAQTSLKTGLLETYQWQESHKSISPSEVGTLMSQPVRLSAVIACYKDAQAIPVMYERLVKTFTVMRVDYEIIFVNDASPDDTAQVLEAITAKDNRVIGIEHSRNFGSQSAFLSGMQIATGDAVILLDGDLQDPPEVIPAFYEKWKEGNEVVYGRRIKRLGSKVMGFFYKLFYRLFQRLSYISIPVDAGDFSLIDRKVVSELLALPETEQFLRGLRAWVGFKQTGVDYVRPERLFGTTTNNFGKNIGWAKKAIFSFSFAPLQILSTAGVFLTGVSFVAMITQMIAKILWPNVPHGITSIISLILFFGGIQILGISILGEYIIKIFEETKKRPKFIRRSIRQGRKQWQSMEEMDGYLKGRKE